MFGKSPRAPASKAPPPPGWQWPTSPCSPHIAYLFFNRGIELIGAARAGQSWHLMPVFGSVLAVLLLHETFYPFHAVGIALIAGGIGLASIRAATASGPQQNLKRYVRGGA
jgi:drug/metabolite transporter (DMT)-like permease